MFWGRFQLLIVAYSIISWEELVMLAILELTANILKQIECYFFSLLGYVALHRKQIFETNSNYTASIWYF